MCGMPGRSRFARYHFVTRARGHRTEPWVGVSAAGTMQQAAAEAAAAYRPFSYTHVVYVEGDRLGWALSGAALLPIFIVVAYATLIASRRDLATVAMLIGQLAN